MSIGTHPFMGLRCSATIKNGTRIGQIVTGWFAGYHGEEATLVDEVSGQIELVYFKTLKFSVPNQVYGRLCEWAHPTFQQN